MSSDAVQRAPYAVSPPRYSVSRQMVTTTLGVTEVLAYGTAVIVEPLNPEDTFRS